MACPTRLVRESSALSPPLAREVTAAFILTQLARSVFSLAHLRLINVLYAGANSHWVMTNFPTPSARRTS